jgi:hypothetical protein
MYSISFILAQVVFAGRSLFLVSNTTRKKHLRQLLAMAIGKRLVNQVLIEIQDAFSMTVPGATGSENLFET